MQSQESCKWASFILRISLLAIYLPVGISKTIGFPVWWADFGGYSAASQGIIQFGSTVAPMWLAVFMGYTLPIVHLYNGIGLLLGFGGRITKITLLYDTIAIAGFFVLMKGAEFEWFFNPHLWFFVAAFALFFLPGWGPLALDNKMKKN